MIKIILLFFILFIQTFSSDVYIPKNIQEKNILEKYRKKNLILGLSNSNLFQEKINNDSINLIIKELFSDYLKLNVKYTVNNWDILYKEYKNNKIDILGNLTHSLDRSNHSCFSLPLFDQTLYVASNSIKVKNIEDINNKNIYTLKDSIYNKYLYNLISSKNMNITLISVNKKMDYKDKLILGPKKEIGNLKYKIKLITLPGLSMALHNKYKDLIPLINNALNEKYLKKIQNLLIEKQNNDYKNNFYSSLTMEEKKYLKNLKPLKLAYESDQNIVYYSKEYNNYIGFFPLMIQQIQERSSLEFEIVDNNFKTLGDLYKGFLNEKIDILPLAKNKDRINIFKFTDQVESLNLFKITNYRYNKKKIGVIKNSIEESVASNYYPQNEIKVYNNYQDLREDLISHKIMGGFFLSRDGLSTSNFKIEKIMDIPIYLGVHKDDIILRNILNKAIRNLLNLKELKEKSIIDINYERFIKNQKIENKNIVLLYLLGITLLLFILAIFKILFHRKMTIELKKDTLTGLKNRSEFNNFKNKNLYFQGYVISIDINNLKDFNDKYGQHVGDFIILKISKFLKESFLANNIFRITGDEFYIFLNDKNIQISLNKLMKNIDNFKHSYGYSVNLNIGYCYCDNELLEKTLKYADMAMYESKEIHSSMFLEATDILIEKKEREYLIKNLLREGNLSDIFPLFQPKFNIESGDVIGCEALARWSNKKLGFISPGEFIPIAENIKQIHLIDFKIAEESIKIIKYWKQNNLVPNNFKLSFNVSMQTFETKDFIIKLESLLKKYNIPGNYIEIEITESILSSNLNITLEKLNSIKELGIQVSIDDFTAGHSTASLLPYLPVDIIKFDKSILDIINDKNIYNHSIYKNLITLVKDLNLKIVAEGIETDYQLNFLKENKVDMGQGFLFSKPISKHDFENLLK